MITLVFGCILALAAIVPLASAVQTSSGTTHSVQVGASGNGIEGNGFFPSVLVIRAGDTVVWTVSGDAPHTVTSSDIAVGHPLFDSTPNFDLTPQVAAVFFGPGGFLAPGASFTVDTSTLAPGTYRYQCTLHDANGMNGTLTVTSDAAPAGAVVTVTVGWTGAGSDITFFSPSTLTVAHGTKVIFTNQAALEPHDVVSEVTLVNGTTILGTFFDSAPNLVPPGISETALDSGPPPFPIGPGGVLIGAPGLNSYNYTFSQPGTFIYYCKFHSAVVSETRIGMVGEIIVLPAYASTQEVANVQAQVTAAQGSVNNLQTAVGNAGQSAQDALSQISMLNMVAYAALAVAIVLGAAAIFMSRKK